MYMLDFYNWFWATEGHRFLIGGPKIGCPSCHLSNRHPTIITSLNCTFSNDLHSFKEINPQYRGSPLKVKVYITCALIFLIFAENMAA
jgi:hypothetical protein